MSPQCIETQSETTAQQCQDWKKVPHIWLMASPKYIKTMDRLLSTFRRAGEPVRVTVRWVPDFKDTTQTGFELSGTSAFGLRVYDWNYRKLLLLFEAYLDALQEGDRMVLYMDLDMQVHLGLKMTKA